MTKLCNNCQKQGVFSLQKRVIKSGEIKYHERHECNTCRGEKVKVIERRNPERTKRNRKKFKLKRNYGMSLEEYSIQFQQQKELCAICGISLREIPERNIHVDHCHSTGKWRGILCSNCNRGLGYFQDKAEFLLKASQYIESCGGWSRSRLAEKQESTTQLVIAR